MAGLERAHTPPPENQGKYLGIGTSNRSSKYTFLLCERLNLGAHQRRRKKFKLLELRENSTLRLIYECNPIVSRESKCTNLSVKESIFHPYYALRGMKIKHLLGGRDREILIMYIGAEGRSVRKEVVNSP